MSYSLNVLLRGLFVLLTVFSATSLPAVDLVPFSTSWKYYKGTSEASSPDMTAWRQPSFDDSAWLAGPSPFYYDTETDNAELPFVADKMTFTGTVLSDMNNRYTCVFFRKTFNISSPVGYEALTFTAACDDGYVVWLNGRLLTNYNTTVTEPTISTTVANATEPAPQYIYTLPNATSWLKTGVNVLAIQAFNTSSTSSDFGIMASLTASADTNAPVVSSLNPPAGAVVNEFFQMEVFFNESVTNVDAADLLINNIPATDLIFEGPGQFLFSFPPPATGVVSVAWASTNGITDRSLMLNPFAGGSYTLTYNPNSQAALGMITEFMAYNKKTLRDEDGDASDWIEIYNPGPTVLPLRGWFLTDDQLNPTKWSFPSYSLAANTYLVVFASGKDRTNSAGRLHTNFKLGSGGGYLALLTPGQRVVSEFSNYPSQQLDVSYGRDRTAVTNMGYYTTPTPGAANSARGSGFSSDVQFSRSSGTFVTAFNLALTTADPNSVIRYTLDGTMPTNTSYAYSAPLPISTTARVRARAFTPGLFPGSPHTEVFMQMNSTMLSVTSDLPIVIINNFGVGSPSAAAIQAVQNFVFEPGITGVTRLTNEVTLSTRGSIKRRGSSTQDYPKPSLGVEFWDEFNDDQHSPLLGMPSDSDWVYYAPNNFEPVLIHNPVAHDLSRKMGVYSPRTRFAEVYIVTDTQPLNSGHYSGIYVIEEKIKISGDRVNIDSLQPENTTAPSVTGGYLMKVDRTDPGENPFNAGGQTVCYVDPKYAEITLPQRDAQEQYIINYINQFGTALNGANFADPVTGYAAYVDVDAAINHHIQNVVTFNVDALRLSAYLYKPRNGKLTFGPNWDYDRTQFSTDGRDLYPRSWHSPNVADGTDYFGYTWWNRLCADTNFWQKWIDRYEELREGPLSTNSIYQSIQGFANQVRAAQPRELAKWNQWPRSSTSAGAPMNNVLNGTFQGEVEAMKLWYRERLNFIDTNFIARPTFNLSPGFVTAGSILTISGPVGSTIYYTLNGVDPFASGGGIDSRALIYSQPIFIANNVRVVARARNVNHRNLTGSGNPVVNSIWSGNRTGTFVVQTPSLAITEIMYHPEPAPAGDTNATGNFEYIELKNTGQSILNLSGFRFTNGITFDFTGSPVASLRPGEYVLVVKNLAAFLSRYPGTTNIAGEFTGSLNNGGDKLYLEGPMRETVLNFSFDSTWSPMTDGNGFSLVVTDESAPFSSWTSQAQWRSSAAENGSPGQADPPLPVISPVYINELLTHPIPPAVDTIELFNPNASAVAIGGWFLSDDFNTPRKFRIPDGTEISAGGFMVFDENNFNIPGLLGGFGFDHNGESAWLFSADAQGNLTGYYHGFNFGYAPLGVTYGRYVDSQGADHLLLQTSNTLGAANSGPILGPVVISELMYHPPDSVVGTNYFDNQMDEFVELNNPTELPVPLFDPSYPTNTWHLRGGIDFVFPENITLPPGGFVLVVSFDPATNQNTTALFMGRYGIAPGTPLFGPYGGKLNNLGDNVELARPDAPVLPPSNNAGHVSYILVDKVNFTDGMPWPCGSSGSGNSLQRLGLLQYGNDPIHWVAAAPTAAGLTIPQIPGAPTILNLPQTQAVPVGSNALFSVQVCGLPPIRYQWRHDGADMLNATNDTLSLRNVQPIHGGAYAVVVSNSAGATTSAPPAQLIVQTLPVIARHPIGLTNLNDTTVAFDVVVNGNPPFQYQWQYNGVYILNATNSRLVLTNAQMAQAGTYRVQVSNTAGSVWSDSATLKILIYASIFQQPADQGVKLGSNAVFTASVTSSIPLRLQWRWNGVPIEGANKSSLTISNVQIPLEGLYDLVVEDDVRSVVSRSARLAALQATVFTQPPLSQSVVQGGTVTFSFAFTGNPPPFTTEWRRVSTTIMTQITSQCVGFFRMTNVQTSDATTYRVVVKNQSNPTPGVTHAGAIALTVLADSNHDGIPDAWEVANSFATNGVSQALEDSDGDGMSNFSEYIAGTNPRDPASCLKVELLPSGNGASVAFNAVSNRTYSVEFADGLNNPWQGIANIIARTTNRVETIPDPGYTTNRFYRIRTPVGP